MRNWLGRIVDRIAPEAFRFDPYALHGDCAISLQIARERDWLRLEGFINERKISERSLLIEAISEAIHDDHYFDDWVSCHPHSATAQLLRGSLLLKRAWTYRGYGRGHEIGDEAAVRFSRAIEQSFQDLSLASNGMPDDPEPHGRSIRALMGLNAEWSEIDISLARLNQSSSIHFIGNLNYLIASCEKWLGSHSKMFEFARQRAADARLAGLIPAAHFEMHFYLERIENDPQAAREYFCDPKVISEILAAQSAFLHIETYPQSATYVLNHNIFALTLSIADRLDDAREHFAAVGRQITRYAWEFYDDRYFQDQRRLALLKAP